MLEGHCEEVITLLSRPSLILDLLYGVEAKLYDQDHSRRARPPYQPSFLKVYTHLSNLLWQLKLPLKLDSLQGSSDYRYKIAGIYLTSHESWDVLGISPKSNRSDGSEVAGSYQDGNITQMIKNYNAEIRLANTVAN